MLLKCCIQYASKIRNSAVATGLEKVSFHSNPKERQCQKCSNYCTVAFISHSSKVMFKILQARYQQYLNCEFPDVQVGFRKGRGSNGQYLFDHPKIKSSRKTSTSALLTTPKLLTVWITINCGKFFKRWEY